MAAYYYVNKVAQSNGDHEVHASGCSHMPSESNRISLGYHNSCWEAVEEARKHYKQVNGCVHCSKACHTG